MSRDLRFLFTASTKLTKFSGAPSSEKIKKSRTIWKLTSFGYITLATCAVRRVHVSLAKAITGQTVVPAYLQLIFCNLLIPGSSISSTIVLRTATNRCTLKEEKTLSPRREKASCGCDDSATIGATLWLTSKRIAGLSVHVSCFLFGKELLGHKTSKEKALGFSHFRKKCKFSNNTTSLLLIYGGKTSCWRSKASRESPHPGYGPN